MKSLFVFGLIISSAIALGAGDPSEQFFQLGGQGTQGSSLPNGAADEVYARDLGNGMAFLLVLKGEGAKFLGGVVQLRGSSMLEFMANKGTYRKTAKEIVLYPSETTCPSKDPGNAPRVWKIANADQIVNTVGSMTLILDRYKGVIKSQGSVITWGCFSETSAFSPHEWVTLLSSSGQPGNSNNPIPAPAAPEYSQPKGDLPSSVPNKGDLPLPNQSTGDLDTNSILYL